MPKPIVNDKIIYRNMLGRIARHDELLDQYLLISSSPTFANIQITGDASIMGNMYVYGNMSILDTNIVQFEDNIILLNKNESGNGISLNESGIEINRGSLENYRIVYDEPSQSFLAGVISNLHRVGLCENTLLDNGVMTWNDTTKLMESRDTISIQLVFDSTTNSTSVTTGALVLYGGMGVAKNLSIGEAANFYGSSYTDVSMIYTDQTSGNMEISSTGEINLESTNINIPQESLLTFGSDNSINSSSSGNFVINTLENINFNVPIGKKISVPNQVPITFSTINEKIYTDSSNNMMIEGTQNIELTPGPLKKVIIPSNIGLVFGGEGSPQEISSNITNDLTLDAGNNIFLNPGPTLDVRIPVDCGVKFGTGNQRISSDSMDLLTIQSSTDINLTVTNGNHVNLPVETYLTFGGYTQSILSDTASNLIFNTPSDSDFDFIGGKITLTNTENSICATTGSINTPGGLGVGKDIVGEGKILLVCDTTGTLDIKKIDLQSVFTVDTAISQVNIQAGDGSFTGASLQINNESSINAQSLIQLKSQFDSTPGYAIGRGKNDWFDGRALSINLPSYADYSSIGEKPTFIITDNETPLFSVESNSGNVTIAGNLTIMDSTPADSGSTGSLLTLGGVRILQNIVTNGDYVSDTLSTQAMTITDTGSFTVFNINTINKEMDFNGTININNTTGILLQLNNAFIVDAATNMIQNNFINLFTNTTDASNLSTASVVFNGGVSIQEKLIVSDTVYLNNQLDLGSTKIINLQNPDNPQDAATKEYVDLVKQGLYVKDSVKVASTTLGNLVSDFSIGSIIDDYTLQSGDRILIKDQFSQIENGIYIVSSGSPLRSDDLASGMSASGIFVFVQQGTINNALGWICNSISGSDIVDTDPLNFTQFTGLGQVDAGNGLSKNFNQINVNVDDTSIEVFNDALRIKNTALGTGLTGGSGSVLQTTSDQSHVTKLGTINTGSWQANTIQVPFGGTGRTIFTVGNVLFGNGINGLNTSSKLYFDPTNTRFGIGLSSPTYNLHIQTNTEATILLNADSDALAPNAKPVFTFAHSGVSKGILGVTRNYNEFANNSYPEAFVISQPELNSNSAIQLATQQQTRLTILPNGYIGVNTSIPSYNLHIKGDMQLTGTGYFISTTNSTNISNGSIFYSGGVSIAKGTSIGGITHIYSTIPSTNVNTGCLIVDGGMSINCNQNAANFGDGGALTVGGGASFNGDIYVTGAINGSGSSSSTYAYLTLTATDQALNLSTGALVTFGGITIQSTENAINVSNGGGLLVAGGMAVGSDFYLGGSQYIYGSTGSKYFTPSNGIINIYSNNSAGPLRYSIDRNISTNDFSISRYNSSSILIEKSISINYTTGSITFANSNTSISPSSASLILNGGISIQCSVNAVSLTNGGAATFLGGTSINKNLLVGGDLHIYSTTQSTCYTNGAFILDGGASISKDLYVNGNTNINNNTTINGLVNLSGNGLLQTINNTSGSQAWFYFGIISPQNTETSSYCDIDFINGLNQNQTLPLMYGLKFIGSFNNSTGSFSHNYYGNVDESNDIYKSVVYIFDDATKYHLFIQTPANSTTQVRVNNKSSNKFIIYNEGNSTYPNGSVSGFDSWTMDYQTNNISNLGVCIGDLISKGDTVSFVDNLPIIGKNTIYTNNSRNLGLLFQKYQISNDSGSGEVVTEPYQFLDSLPTQAGASLYQVKLSSLASTSDNYYNGWFIKVGSGSNINQVRQITTYNGSQRVCGLDSPWTIQNPTIGDTVYLYNSNYISMYYDYSLKTFRLALAGVDTQTSEMVNYGDYDLQLKRLVVTDSTDKSIYTLGGISINNTNDSSSITNGGTFTTLGGGSFSKTLLVGNSIGIGNSLESPLESIHIQQTSGTIRLQNDTGNYSYIDFVENTTGNRFGIISDDSTHLFSLSYTMSDDNPKNATKAITINQSGYIGINSTSNINSPLTINSSNFISTNSTSGYIGLQAGDSNTNSTNARIILYANGGVNSTSSGNIAIYTGTTGTISLNTQDTTRILVKNNGDITISNTTISSNSTTGALVINGGMGISATQNSSSYTQGGSLTIAGGGSVNKDLYVGGNLYVAGGISAGGSTSSPTMSFSNTSNCSILSYDNSNLIGVSNQGILSFSVSVTPLSADSNCQFEFTIPSKSNALVTRRELVASCTAYTDDTNLISLYNVLVVGVPSSTNGLVKFQSASTATHYFDIICRYTMD